MTCPSASKRAAERLQQQQRGQADNLRFALEEPQQQAGKANGLIAQCESQVCRIARRRVALVENQINHGRDGRETLRAFHGTRSFEGQLGLGDLRLGPRDPLLHGALAHQEGARDLLDGEAGNDAQGQRDLLGRRKIGMTADEQQPQKIVAVVGAIDPLGELRLHILEIGQGIVGGQRLLTPLASGGVDRGVSPHQYEPRRGVPGRSVAGPIVQCAQARVLVGLFGRIHVAEIAQQGGDRLGAGGYQRGIDPRRIIHSKLRFARSTDTGLNS